MKSFVLAALLFACVSAQAKTLKVLFIGNSYTYLPKQGEPNDPALPKMIAKIVSSINPSLHLDIQAHTVGGYSFEKHLNDPESLELMKKSFDKVVLQGESIESLELPPWWEDHHPTGVAQFRKSLPKIVALVKEHSPDITLYVNWGWGPKNEHFRDDDHSLRFPPGHPRAGQTWNGRDKFELQKMIDESYARETAHLPVALSKVGDAWLKVQTAKLAEQDELYLPNDWSHPSLLGSYIAALVLARDVFKVDIAKNKFVPTGLNSKRARAIQKLLAH